MPKALARPKCGGSLGRPGVGMRGEPGPSKGLRPPAAAKYESEAKGLPRVGARWPPW